jgi:hypothetical protein
MRFAVLFIFSGLSVAWHDLGMSGLEGLGTSALA